MTVVWIIELLTITLFCAAVGCFLREHGISVFPKRGDLLRQPILVIAFLCAFVGSLVQYAVCKNPPLSAPPIPPPQSQLPTPSQQPQTVNCQLPVLNTSLLTPSFSPTNLRFVSILPLSNSVLLGVAWPPSNPPPDEWLDFYSTSNLVSGAWEAIGTASAPSNAPGVEVEVPHSALVGGETDIAFFAFGTRQDTDGDGLADAYERFVSHTDPALADTDRDGLPDGWEVEHGLDPLSDEGDDGAGGDPDDDDFSNFNEWLAGTSPVLADTDGDGLSDLEECGSIIVLPQFEWHDTSACPPVYWRQEVDDYAILDPLPADTWLSGEKCKSIYAFGKFYVAIGGKEDLGAAVFPVAPEPLNGLAWNCWTFLVVPYWTFARLENGNTNSWMCIGHLSGTNVVEYHNTMCSGRGGLTCQVVLPSGTGNVVRVSYLSSEFVLDGTSAVVGVQNKCVESPSGFYNLTWDFAARGPIVPPCTVEYRIGTGTNPLAADSDGDDLADAEEIALGTDPWAEDTDGDGLVDGDEVEIGTSPLSVDTDGDGLPDGWEVRYGLDPMSGLGVYGASGDPDGDGVLNRDECRYDSHPWLVDTDGDGLGDFDEVGGYSTNSIPWLTIVSPIDLTPRFDHDDFAIYTWNPQAPLYFHGIAVNNINVNLDGCVYFTRVGEWRPFYMLTPTPDSLTMPGAAHGNSFTVAPYWGDMALTPNEPAPRITAGTAYHGTNAYCVVQYDDIAPLSNYWREGFTNSLSWQIAVPFGNAENVYVRYRDLRGAEDGRDAVVGFADFNRANFGMFCHYDEGWVTNGAAFSVRVGTGTDPTLADTEGHGAGDCAVLLRQRDSSRMDFDNDGLPDLDEILNGTDAYSPDTDGDGLPDGWEVRYGLDPMSGLGVYGASGDPDGDGLANSLEYAIGASPLLEDTDGDGIDDYSEWTNGTNPAREDTDLDGISDCDEYSYMTDPLQPDSDGDGMDDGWELEHGFDPCSDNSQTPSPDDDADADPDGDGLTNAEECAWGTNPSGADANNDGIPDGWDSDGDGVSDGAEVAQNSDPAEVSEGGVASSRVPVNFYFGDPSGSQSEKYRLTVSPVAGCGTGTTPRAFSWLNANYGACETKTAMLKPGWKYEVKMEWASCKYPWDGINYPNYDYTLSLGNNVPSNVVVDDPDNLFRSDYYGMDYYGTSHFPVLDATVEICALQSPEIIVPDVVGVNNDDDNGNGVLDWEDHFAVQDDDDVAEVRVRIHCPEGMSGTATVAAFVNGAVGTLFKDAGKSQPVGYDTFPVSGEFEKTYYLEGCNPSSGVGFEHVHVSFQCGGATLTNMHDFTFVERIAEPITTERVNGQIVNPCCAILGESTPMRIKVLPETFPDSQIKWRVVSGSGSFSGGDTGRDVMFVADGSDGDTTVLQVDVGDVQGAAPQFTLRNTTMHEVKIYPCVISRMGRPSPITQAHLDSMLVEVNAIFRQVGIHFTYGALITNVTNDVFAENGLINTNVATQIHNLMGGTDGLEIYFIPGCEEEYEPLGRYNANGIIVRNICNAKTVAHEIGHACGWNDIYIRKRKFEPSELFQGLRREWMPNDWNNGSGCRFYDPMLSQRNVIQRILMYGEGGNIKVDIPSGEVHALSASGVVKKVNVGLGGIITFEPFSF